MAPKPVHFSLQGDVATLRIALAAGYELELTAGRRHSTVEPAEIAALDAHPAARRVTTATKAKAKAKKSATAAVPAAEEATSA